jgi:CheY-like chemotaxis protein/HPt (histidine-containing phosphotransfer) domain-containing protein
VVVGNGREALAALDRRRFDAVLMDVQMPEMDGFEATAAIRAREAATGSRIPIIAMTAHNMKGDRDRCLGAGMDAYVSKPLRPEQLFEVLEGMVPAAEGAERSADGAAAFDRASALDRAGGDEELLRELVGLFLDECPQRMAEIREALARRDAPKLQRAAHTLRGAVANFEAREAVEAARRLETVAGQDDWARAEQAWAALEEAIDRLEPAMAEVRRATAAEPGGGA